MTTWPDYPSNENPFFGDGKTYGRELGRVSPEGNTYGQMRIVRDWVHRIWWDGRSWVDVEIAGEASSLDDLPTGPRPFGEIWRVPVKDKLGNYISAEYFYGENGWQPLKWMWTIDDVADIPIPGYQVGEAHIVQEHEVPVLWTGYTWERIKHSVLELDEELHLPPGFLQMLAPDAQLVFVTDRELTLEKVQGGTGRVWVSGEYIEATYATSVFNTLPALNWDSQQNEIVTAYLEPDTEYWVYLANTQSPELVVDALPGDSTHNPTQDWDFRGRLFLSLTPETNGKMATTGAGANARLVGKIQTDTTPVSEEGPRFVRELDISLISRTTSFHEVYREFSDYRLEFVNEASIKLARIPGTYGQIYIARNLYYLGYDYTLTVPGVRIDWDGALENRVWLNDTELELNTTYYVYIAAKVDAFNFNELNLETNRPWQAEDAGSGDYYDANLDYRLKPFLSSATPDNTRMSEEWPGFYTRHIGQVATDANGWFKNASDLSAIRQPTLNPTYFDGLAEISFVPMNSNEFRVTSKQGTSGIVLVGGEPVKTYSRHDSQVHKVTTSDAVYAYNESTPNSPLTAQGVAADYASQVLYLYLANSRSMWGSKAGRLVLSTQPPSAGYLSQNWCGNNARWLASIQIDANGLFSGTFVVDSIAPPVPAINDWSVTPNDVWSASKISGELSALYALISSSQLFENQKTVGCSLKLEMSDSGNLVLKPTLASTTISFPDSNIRTISSNITIPISGSVQTLYYVYISTTGQYISTDAPTTEYSNLQVKGNDILVGYFSLASTDILAGEWNVYSFWNQPTQQWAIDLLVEEPNWTSAAKDVWHEVIENLGVPGIVCPAGVETTVFRTGTSIACARYWTGKSFVYVSSGNADYGLGTFGNSKFWIDLAILVDGEKHYSQTTLNPGIYQDVQFRHAAVNAVYYYPWAFAFFGSTEKSLVLTRLGR